VPIGYNSPAVTFALVAALPPGRLVRSRGHVSFLGTSSTPDAAQIRTFDPLFAGRRREMLYPDRPGSLREVMRVMGEAP
jgi:hypothetical protein